MKLDQLTFTRYIAALTVVFFHFGESVFPANIESINPIVTAGPIAVSYFFVLSGFIMAVAYYSSENTIALNKGKYWVARVARVYPVYLLALVLMIIASFRKEGLDFTTITLNLTMLQSWFTGGYPLSLNSPGWSLSVEAFFYLSFPLWLFLAQRKHFILLILVTVILWFGTQILQTALLNNWINASLGITEYVSRGTLHEFLFYNPLMHLNTFVLGFVVGVYFCQNKIKTPNTSINTIALIVITGITLLFLANQHTLESWLGFKIAYNNGLIAPLFLAVIILLALDRTIISKTLSLPILVLLGEASYSLYILQRPIYGIYKQLAPSWLPVDSALHFYIFLIGLTIIAICSFLWLETPLRKMINRWYSSSGKLVEKG